MWTILTIIVEVEILLDSLWLYLCNACHMIYF